MSLGRVDVVIPTHNTRELTLRCLEELNHAGDGIAIRCIVVDNASRDGTAEAIRRLLPGVDVIRNARNAGFGQAANQGARLAAGDYLLILNSDAIARRGAVARLARFMSEHPDYVVAAGQLVYEGTNIPQVGFAIRGFPTLAGQLALMTGFERFWIGNPISRRQAMHDFDYRRTQEVDGQPAGACLICRRDDFEAIGGFDEDFYYWFEDVDLLQRLRARGRIGYVHDAIFEHAGGTTFSQWRRPEVVVTRYSSLLRYFSKHHSRWEQLVLRAAVAALAFVRAVPLLLVDRSRARAYGLVLRLALNPPSASRR
jgi:N-acetylglucosaminyl-diphospho-decaprenol L-rhamnosyltransferase